MGLLLSVFAVLGVFQLCDYRFYDGESDCLAFTGMIGKMHDGCADVDRFTVRISCSLVVADDQVIFGYQWSAGLPVAGPLGQKLGVFPERTCALIKLFYIVMTQQLRQVPLLGDATAEVLFVAHTHGLTLLFSLDVNAAYC